MDTSSITINSRTRSSLERPASTNVSCHRPLSLKNAARTPSGRVIDPVARFHLNNGARLERLNLRGDLSASGQRQSLGLMVNYLYDLDHIETNHEAFANRGVVAASSGVRKLAQPFVAKG